MVVIYILVLYNGDENTNFLFFEEDQVAHTCKRMPIPSTNEESGFLLLLIVFLISFSTWHLGYFFYGVFFFFVVVIAYFLKFSAFSYFAGII